ncbi:MAG: ABC transporter permease [Desulfamplus sp.]|nr:ABC transporter permease [Desulfamplus sp.]
MSKIKTYNIVYIPNRLVQQGFWEGWKEMYISLLNSRELTWRLFLRDFSAKYRQSVLGAAWAVLNPIFIVGVFVFLNKSGILFIGDTKVPYPVFALVGISLYSIFSTGLSAASNSIIGAGPMVTKINFPKISLVIASFGQALVEFAVRLILLVILFIVFHIYPRWGILLFPLSLIPIVILTVGLGFFLSLLTGIFRDTVHVVSLITTFLLFITPVLYPSPNTGMFVVLNTWNPVSHLIMGCRDILLSGTLSNKIGFMWSSIFSIFVFFLFWRVFHIAETRIAERI